MRKRYADFPKIKNYRMYESRKIFVIKTEQSRI